MKKFLIIALLSASCDETVYPYQLEACRKMCEPRPVERASRLDCACEKAHPSDVVDAIKRLAN